MSLWEAVVLGLLQGITEFFPVSSSGHLVLAESLLGVNPPGVSFEVLVHLATLAAVLVFYRRKIASLLSGAARGEHSALRYLGMLGLASIPAVLVGLTLTGVVSRLFDMPLIAAVNLLVTGFVVYSTRWLVGRGEQPEPGWAGSFAVGVAQAVAILPGISRSGATVATALWARTGRDAAAEFSFLLSIPVILGASAMELPGLTLGVTLSPAAILLAALSAFLAGMAAIVLFVRWLRSGVFHRFAYYCWAVGGAYVLYALFAS